MDIRVLKYFIAVAREENITRAANTLHITQPTLSRQLIQMENEFGVKLFIRGKHNIILTEEGMFLRRRAQEIVELAEKTKKDITHSDDNVLGNISIGCGETKNMDILCKMLSTFQNKYTNVNFDIYTAIADDVKERLENGVLDMGLLMKPVEISQYNFINMPISEKWYILVRKDSILANKNKITPKDLIGVPLIVAKRQSVRNELENWFGDDFDKIKIVSTLNLSAANMCIMVENGIGVAVTIETYYYGDNLCLIPLEPEIVNGCVLVWKKEQTMSKAMSRFVTHVKEYIKNN